MAKTMDVGAPEAPHLAKRPSGIEGLDEVTGGGGDVGQSHRQGRFLIVDDNVDAAETLMLLLEELGHQARVATDGGAAIEAAVEFRPDVIFMDLGLPGMSGYAVARQLRPMAELAGTILIALTGYGRDEDRRLSREAGFDQHWVKPLDPDALDQLLADLTTPARLVSR